MNIMAAENETPHRVSLGDGIGRHLKICALSMIVLAACYLAFVTYVMESLPVSRSNMDRIQPGLPLATVRSILGDPDRENLRDDGTASTWAYSPPLHWQIFYVRFDRDGYVTESELDR